jgi:hypothetical protein
MLPHDRVGRTERAQDEETRRLASLGEDGEEIDRGVVAPLEVFEDQHEGDLGGKRLDAGRQLVQRMRMRARDGADHTGRL